MCITHFQVDIGTVTDIESDAIVYIIPRLDIRKYIKVARYQVENHFETMINLFKNLRILHFVWNRPIESENCLLLTIGCNDGANTFFITPFNSKYSN